MKTNDRKDPVSPSISSTVLGRYALGMIRAYGPCQRDVERDPCTRPGEGRAGRRSVRDRAAVLDDNY